MITVVFIWSHTFTSERQINLNILRVNEIFLTYICNAFTGLYRTIHPNFAKFHRICVVLQTNKNSRLYYSTTLYQYEDCMRFNNSGKSSISNLDKIEVWIFFWEIHIISRKIPLNDFIYSNEISRKHICSHHWIWLNKFAFQHFSESFYYISACLLNNNS